MTETEISTLIDIFDKAITSDAPAVTKLLKNLLLVTSITENSNVSVGPIRALLNEQDKRISKLEMYYEISRLNETNKYDQNIGGAGIGYSIGYGMGTAIGPIGTSSYITGSI